MSGVEFRPRFMSKTVRLLSGSPLIVSFAEELQLKAEVEKNNQKAPTSRSGGFDKDRIPPITVLAYSDKDNDYQLVPTIVGELTRGLTEDLENKDEDNDNSEVGESEGEEK